MPDGELLSDLSGEKSLGCLGLLTTVDSLTIAPAFLLCVWASVNLGGISCTFEWRS